MAALPIRPAPCRRGGAAGVFWVDRNALHDVEPLFETGGIKTRRNVCCLIRRDVIADTRHGPGIWSDYANSFSRCGLHLHGRISDRKVDGRTIAPGRHTACNEPAGRRDVGGPVRRAGGKPGVDVGTLIARVMPGITRP